MTSQRTFDSGRRFVIRAAAAVGGTALAGSALLREALAQDPPGGCPAPPTGGTSFQPGQDQRPIVLRSSISSLGGAQLSELQNAYAALRVLPPTDPRSWVLQADLHALYCEQCSNDATQIHFKWNFFPWHRAYLYFYERILGSLVNNLNGFRLPYWDWEHARAMPAAYRAPAAATNSLWDQKRDSGIASGGNLPVGHGDPPNIAQLNATQDFATFGGTVGAAGACEGNPHGQIHNDVGQPPPGAQLDMGNLGFAARDPIFFAHHANIDKLWSNWNALAAKTGLPAPAYRNPTESSFLNATWSFYDENSQVVSIRAADVLDHSTNLRYIYSPELRIPRIYEIIECHFRCCGPDPEREPFLEIPAEALRTVLTAARAHQQTALVLREVAIPAGVSGNFEVFAIRGEHKTLLGSFGIVGETKMAMRHPRRMTLLLDATKALPDLAAREKPATLRLVPSRGTKAKAFTLQARGAELRISRAEPKQRD